MRRRTFLKLVGLTAGAASLPAVGLGAAAASPSARPGLHPVVRRAEPSTLRYRGRGGRIFVSATGGRTWKLHTNLGPAYDVERLVTDGAGGVQATVAFGGRTFPLSLAPDLRSWMTV
jgi:hypothetical protein